MGEIGVRAVRSLSFRECLRFWDEFEAEARKRGEDSLKSAVRLLCQNDLFYLLVRGCKRVDMLHPWIYERTREVEKDPDNHLDLWAREHYKSTVITYGLTISDILNDPETTFGIFSHTRPIAKAFLRQIMREFENNTTLNAVFPDILWGDQIKDAPKWSEDEGIIVRRKTNPNEATVEAWGVVDGQPTSKHFKILIYDDVVVRESVTNPEMMAKTMSQLEVSYNLGRTDGGSRRFIGTRWHYNDAYKTIMDRGTAKLRWYPGREGGDPEGASVYWSDEIHQQKRRDMGPYNYASQILLTPTADSLQNFNRQWLRHYERINEKNMTKYLLVDPASSKKTTSDYTAMMVVGLGTDGNYYILDMVRDRLNLTERTARVFQLHRKWKPKEVRYEKYGLSADIEHIKATQENESYRFEIKEVGGITRKSDRVARLIPLFEQHKVYLPRTFYVTDYQKVPVDLVKSFIEEEYCAFPVGIHEDMLDALARIAEPELPLTWPRESEPHSPPIVRSNVKPQHAWMS